MREDEASRRGWRSPAGERRDGDDAVHAPNGQREEDLIDIVDTEPLDSLLKHIPSYVANGSLDEALKVELRIARRFKTVRDELAKGGGKDWHRCLQEAVDQALEDWPKGYWGKKAHLRESYTKWPPKQARVALSGLWGAKASLPNRITTFASAYPYREGNEWTRVRVISTLLMACGGRDHPHVYWARMKQAYRETGYRLPPKGQRTEANLYLNARDCLEQVVTRARKVGLQRPRDPLEAWLVIRDLGSTQVEETAQQPSSGSPATSEIRTDPGRAEAPSATESEPPERDGTGRSPRRSHQDFEKKRCRDQETGRRGECLVNQHLRQLRKSGKIDCYDWVSEKNAIAPFDFRVCRAGRWERLEVKSTREGFEREYYLSVAELEAIAEDEIYRIARVYDLTRADPTAKAKLDGGTSSGDVPILTTAKMRTSHPLRDFAESIRPPIKALPDGVTIDALKVDPTCHPFDEEVVHLAGPPDDP